MPESERGSDDGSAKAATSPPEPHPVVKVINAIDAENYTDLAKVVSQELKRIFQVEALAQYKILALFDDFLISEHHADKIYAAANVTSPKNKDIYLLIYSRGGSIEPAYLISKTLRALAKEKFIVVVPRRAKSAATLISLGADEIHMGLMSQLGPIDPQIRGMPAMALGDALEAVGELASKYPQAAEVFKGYLVQQAPMQHLGFYKRINESAVQYAERLLQPKKALLPGKSDPGKIAKHLVNYYKDHGFVIDLDEAKAIFGDKIIKADTPEYSVANTAFEFVDLVNLFLADKGKRLRVVGNLEVTEYDVIDTEKRSLASKSA